MQITQHDDTVQHELRRLIPRQFADWQGRYMIEGDPEKRWRDCRVTDISSAGAGLELCDAGSEAIEGCRIILNLQLKAEIRHSQETPNNRRRVGTQFVELSEAERAYLSSLETLDARW